MVVFALTSKGALAYARIGRSSGDASNDQGALAAVRGAGPFPPPPDGATPGQLQFNITIAYQ
jgi:protein TonB